MAYPIALHRYSSQPPGPQLQSAHWPYPGLPDRAAARQFGPLLQSFHRADTRGPGLDASALLAAYGQQSTQRNHPYEVSPAVLHCEYERRLGPGGEVEAHTVIYRQ